MIQKNEIIFAEAVERVRDEIERNPFGEVSVKLVTHAGDIKRVDFTVTQKIGDQK
ncbi:MAG TPA: hypothetical protein PKK43_14320 [Spirochaetota bacterium]|nr:hypothetical protein [Spirochaetota bacterium]